MNDDGVRRKAGLAGKRLTPVRHVSTLTTRSLKASIVTLSLRDTCLSEYTRKFRLASCFQPFRPRSSRAFRYIDEFSICPRLLLRPARSGGKIKMGITGCSRMPGTLSAVLPCYFVETSEGRSRIYSRLFEHGYTHK